MHATHFPHMPKPLHFEGWERWVRRHHFPTAAMFLFYVLPLSAIPPLMLYYAGTHYDVLLTSITEREMMIIGSVFFAAELAMTFLLAAFIEGLGNAASRIMHTRYEILNFPAPEEPSEGVILQHRKIDFRDAYTLAAISPTPLWLVSLSLFIPNIGAVATLGAFALILSLYILYSATPSVLKIEGKGEGILMGWVLLTIGMIGWAAMMYLTFLTWGYVTGLAAT